MHKLLMVDDDRDILHINERYFSQQGYEVRYALSAKEGLACLEGFSPDCILLDVMMPGMDGFELCRLLRVKTDAPILFLTGKLDEEAKVTGLMLGADDYIEKPYSLPELNARIVANIRRHKATHDGTSSRLSFPPLEIDITQHQAYYGSENLNLSNREYDLLVLLASNENELVTFEQIALQMWGSFQKEDRRSVMVSVSRLRKKMEAYVDLAGMIETVWSKGYRFVYRKRA